MLKCSIYPSPSPSPSQLLYHTTTLTKNNGDWNIHLNNNTIQQSKTQRPFDSLILVSLFVFDVFQLHTQDIQPLSLAQFSNTI